MREEKVLIINVGVACHNGSVRRAGMAIGRRAQQRFAYTPQPHPPILRIWYIRGIGGWGWGVLRWVANG